MAGVGVVVDVVVDVAASSGIAPLFDLGSILEINFGSDLQTLQLSN
jgi:hypothetical protein